MLFFIWQKQSGIDCFKDSALEHEVWDRNLCRSPHFMSILILLSLSQKHFDSLILEACILTAQLILSGKLLNKVQHVIVSEEVMCEGCNMFCV